MRARDGTTPEAMSPQHATSNRASTRDPPRPGNTDVVGARIAAQIVDMIVMFGLLLVVLFGLFAALEPGPGAGRALGFVAAIAVALGYGTVLEGGWNGQTVGKRMLDIKVVDRTGDEVGFPSAFVRNVPALFGGWLTWLVGVAAIAVDDRNQRLFDQVAGTYVVGA